MHLHGLYDNSIMTDHGEAATAVRRPVLLGQLTAPPGRGLGTMTQSSPKKDPTPDRGVGLESRADRLRTIVGARRPVISRQKVDFPSAGEMRPCAPSLH